MPSLGFHLSSYPAGHAMAPHVDGCRRLSVVLAGSVVERHGRRDDAGASGSVAIKAADLVHDDRFGPDGAVILSVVLPDPLLDALDLGARWRDWAWLHEGSPRRAALRLAAAAVRRDAGAALGALGELAGPLRESPLPLARSAPPRARLDAIRARLHDDPAREPGVLELAREARLHPATLELHFRRAFGCSIRDYRQRLRAERAAVALLAPGPPLTAVALDHGFFDLSHLTRVFRREFGGPPGAFRRALARGPAAPPPLQSCKTAWSVAL